VLEFFSILEAYIYRPQEPPRSNSGIMMPCLFYPAALSMAVYQMLIIDRYYFCHTYPTKFLLINEVNYRPNGDILKRILKDHKGKTKRILYIPACLSCGKTIIKSLKVSN
jgi:hypothetical protein